MDLSASTLRWQRFVILGTVVLTALAFWTAAPDTFGLPKATILWIAALLLVGLGATRGIVDRAVVVPRSPWVIAVAAVVVAIAVTTLLSSSVALSVVGEYNRYTGLLTYVSYAVAGLVVLRAFDVDEGAQLLRLLTAVVGIASLYVLLQHAGADPFDLPLDIGPVGTFGNVNLVAGFTAIGVPAAVWCALSRTSAPWLRWAAACIALVAFAVSVASRSFQGPAAALPGALLVLGVWTTTADGRALLGPKLKPLAIGAGIVAAGAAAVVGPTALRNGFLERGDFWRAAMSMFSSDPIVGVGFDTYGQHFLAERPAGHAVRLGFTQAESAHNVPLNLLAGGGLLVGLAWLALLVVTAWALLQGLRRLDGEERLLLGGLGGAWLAYLVQSIVSFDVPELGLLHFVLAGVIVAVGVPPHWRTVTLPGTPARRVGRRGSERTEVPGGSYALIALVAVVLLVVGWQALRPLRADLAAARAPDQSRAGDNDAAAATLASATSLAPWQGRYWILRAQLAEAAGAPFDAAGYAGTAAEREPGSSQYALLAGKLNARYRDAATARPYFDSALERDPSNPLVFAEVARFEAGTEGGDVDRARELVDRAVALSPNSHVVWLAVAEVARAEGDEDAARSAYERVLELSPNLGEAITGLSELDQGAVTDGEAEDGS